MAKVQAVFLERMFLWGFIVAWGNSEKMGDQEFIEGQRKAMVSFDEKHGVVATVVRLGAPALGGAGPSTLGAAVARTSGAGLAPAHVTLQVAPTPPALTPCPAPAPKPHTAPKPCMALAPTPADRRRTIVTAVEPFPKPLAVHIEPEASGSKPPAHCP